MPGEACSIATRLARFLSSSCSPPRPTNIVLRSSSAPSRAVKALEVEFDNGVKHCYPAEFLRVQSPSADNKRKTASGELRVVSGRRHVAIMSVEPVGNYGIRIAFDDLHDTGIYTWDFLYMLGQHKFQIMRRYLVALKQWGLGRDPPSRK